MSRSRIAQIYYPIAPGICILSHFPLFRPRSPHRLSAGHCFKCACIFDTVTVWCGEIPAVMRRDSRHACRRLLAVRRAFVAQSDWLHGSARLQAGEPVVLCGLGTVARNRSWLHELLWGINVSGNQPRRAEASRPLSVPTTCEVECSSTSKR